MGVAHHKKKEDIHGNTKWTKKNFEPIIMAIRNGMKRKEATIVYKICSRVLDRKITEYNQGEMK